MVQGVKCIVDYSSRYKQRQQYQGIEQLIRSVKSAQIECSACDDKQDERRQRPEWGKPPRKPDHGETHNGLIAILVVEVSQSSNHLVIFSAINRAWPRLRMSSSVLSH
jgi:hypothetical protein